MDVEVLPGPSLAERARTAVTKARLATLIWADPDPARDRRVTVTIPAPAPLGSLALTGTVWPRAESDGRLGYRLDLRSLRFVGGGGAPVSLADYQAAEPDPLWRMAGQAIQHLERGHLAELICCVRAHGLHQAEWVMPRSLDRFGLELAVISPNGVAAVRLSFPDGPVGSLDEVPASLRAVLACRCRPVRPEP
jgi:hypothetical protein